MPQDSVVNSAPAPYLVVNYRNPTVNRVPPQLSQISMRNKTRIRTSLVPKRAPHVDEPGGIRHFSLCGTASCGIVHRFAWTVVAGASQTAPLRPSAPPYRRPTAWACDVLVGQPPGLRSVPWPMPDLWTDEGVGPQAEAPAPHSCPAPQQRASRPRGRHHRTE
jgi:hypothetical protein